MQSKSSETSYYIAWQGHTQPAGESASNFWDSGSVSFGTVHTLLTFEHAPCRYQVHAQTPETRVETTLCPSLWGSPSTGPGWPCLHLEDHHWWQELDPRLQPRDPTAVFTMEEPAIPRLKVRQVIRATKSVLVISIDIIRIVHGEFSPPGSDYWRTVLLSHYEASKGGHSAQTTSAVLWW